MEHISPQKCLVVVINFFVCRHTEDNPDDISDDVFYGTGSKGDRALALQRYNSTYSSLSVSVKKELNDRTTLLDVLLSCIPRSLQRRKR